MFSTMSEYVTYFISGLVGSGIIYGSFKAQIAQLKQEIEDLKDHGERLAKIETKIDFLISNNKHD